jgi:hypothetical protein
MPTPHRFSAFILTAALVVTGMFALRAQANHSWGSYHWARTSTSFNLRLGDNVTSAWDAYLTEAPSDWNPSTVLDTSIVAGGNKTPKNCRAIAGRVEVCNAKYGNNGWLGIAQIWVNGTHITQGVTKMNDTYFATVSYNTPAWRRLVMCQEIAHTFGLDHQDETFDNVNLGSCMDYTNDPDGGAGGASPSDPSNEHPNAHDFEELEEIYAHLDTTTTVGAALPSSNGNTNLDTPTEWGKAIREDGQGKPSLFERDLGHGNKVFTHVFWAE